MTALLEKRSTQDRGENRSSPYPQAKRSWSAALFTLSSDCFGHEVQDLANMKGFANQ